MKTILVYLVAIVGFAVPAFAQTAVQVAKIDTYVASVKRITNSKRQPKIVVADAGDYEANKTDWRKFASEKALEKFRETTETYSIAYNWKSGGKLVASNFTDFSPSGDWAQYTFHFFRPDGSVAKVEAETRTFMGDYIIIRDYYLDEKGKVIKTRSRYLDLMSRKPKRPRKEMTAPDYFSPEFFTNVDKLPFASLVK